MRKSGRIFVHAAAAAVALGVTLQAHAQTVTDFSGKQLSIIIGYEAGGSYDSFARLFSEQLRKFIPGKPDVIVQSMPGAGGLRMLNTAARIMPSDGTQLFVPPDTLVVTQLTSKENVQFDARKFQFIGAAHQQNPFLAVKRNAASSLADARAREVVIGHSGTGSIGNLIPLLARDTLGIKVKPIAGYGSSRIMVLAMDRGEIDGAVLTWDVWAQAVPQWFQGETPLAVPLLQVGASPDPKMPLVPLLNKLVKPEDVSLVSMFDTIGIVGRCLALPPGVPPELVEQFRNSFQKMIADKEFQEAASKRQLRILPLSGIELQSTMDRVISGADAALLARTRALVEK